MGVVIIFALVTIFCAVSTIKSLKRKNVLAIGFAGLSFLVFGWFTVMTIIAMTHGAGVPGTH